MDRRFSMLAALGTSLLAAATGCGPSFISRTNVEARKEPAEVPVASKTKETDLPKRNPKAVTCVRFGDHRLREAMDEHKNPQEARSLREQARMAYQQALQLDPNCVEAHAGMARLFAVEENHERAVTSYRSALRLLPSEPTLWFELGMCHSRKKEWEPAAEALGKAIEFAPDNVQYGNMLGFCLARAGRFEQSLACFTRTVGEAKARYNVARMMIHVGKVEEGRQQLNLALRLEPTLEDAHRLLARLDRGDVIEADKGVQQVEYRDAKP